MGNVLKSVTYATPCRKSTHKIRKNGDYQEKVPIIAVFG